MNKRIEELIVQAGDYVNETYTGPVPATFTGNPEWHKEFDKWTQFSEKFAQLIVKECVDICNQAILQNQDTLSKLNIDELAEKMVIHGSINQAQKLGKGIKEHFGVEE